MKFKILVLFLISFYSLPIFSQIKDSIKLPFEIAKEKKLSEEDIRNKKEGYYVTGAPHISSDPINGFGYGGEGSLYFNGKKSDPFFEYTPYRAKLDFVLFNTTRNQREFKFKVDVPYIFNTKWRFRAEGGYEANPNLLYFGTTEKTLQGLSYYPENDSSKPIIKDVQYNDYEKNLTGINKYYNNYFKKEGILNISLEHSYLDGKFRLLIGYEVAYVDISSFPGNSLVKKEYDAGKIVGLKKGVVQIYQIGFIYDTRDLETDPSNGIFAELTNELSLKLFGSLYDFNKTFMHINFYHKLFPNLFKKMVIASRFALGYTALNAPFFEYQD